ncbi:hypothetical protein HOE67_02445 [Candidatus Peregrinibacteria bacterium]|jgi:hypothetical protein|nr:hypothetical protein [Candidatus Peregrinibacteria bacterium]MBT4055948.1 hypothetical protein [Candidatus Peregrinibacteria bacterium]
MRAFAEQKLAPPEVEEIGSCGKISSQITTRLKGVYEMLEGACGFALYPVALARSISPSNYQRMERAIDEERKEGIAIHEIGHMLVSILVREDVAGVYINNYSPAVKKTLRLPEGICARSDGFKPSWVLATSKLGYGLFKTIRGPNATRKRFEEMKDIDKIQEIAYLLAGETASVALKGCISSPLTKDERRADTRTDLSKIENFLERDSKYSQIREQLIALVEERLIAFFKRPVTRQMIEIASLKLLDKGCIWKPSGSIREIIYDIFRQEGLAKAEIKKEELAYKKMIKDITKEVDSLFKTI